ncbi:MAG: tandem-95 repeat protein, partial [Vicinamibacterales bacterium]
MTWDEYERIWVGVMIAAPTVDGPFTVRSAEGAIIELRPRAAGDTIDAGSLPVSLFELLTPTDLADASIPQPADLPNDNNGTPLPALLAEGGRVFARLKVSRPDSISEARPVLDEGEVWAGPLNPTPQDVEAADIDGSVGVHAVQLTTNGGVDTINFTWDIGRWAKGDIMLGVNNATYKILDKNGEFKRFLGSADYGLEFEGEVLNEFTTGCAANWRTGEFYATNFDFNQPAVNIFSRHPGSLSDTGYLRPYANSTRKVSTIARRASEPVDGSPIDKAPETLLFDANMNMYVGHSFGYFGPPPTVDVNGTLEPAPGWEAFAVLQDYDDDGEFFPAYYEWGVNGVPIAWSDGGGSLIVDETGALFNVKRIDVDEEFWEPGYGFTSGQLLHDGNALAPFITVSGSELAAPLTLPQAYLANAEDGDWLEREDVPGQRIPWLWPLGKRLHRYNNVSADPLGAPAFSTAARDIFWTFTGQQGTDAIDLSIDNVLYYTSEDTYIHRYDPINGVQLPDFGLGKLQMRNEDRVRRFGGIRLLPPGDGSGGLLVVGGDGVFRFDSEGNYIQEYQVTDDPDLFIEGNPDTGLQLNFYTLEIDPGGRTFWVIPNFTSGWMYQFDIASGRELKRLQVVDYLDPDVDPELPAGRRMEAVCIMWEYTAVQEICGNGQDDDGDGLIDESCSPIEACSVDSPGDDDGDGFVDNNDPDCGLELPPVAADDSYVINQGATLTIAPEASNQVMSNDSDPDNADEDNPLRFDELVVALVGTSGTPATAAGQAVSTTAGGSVTLEADGSFVYTPLPDFHGTDTFVYLINDGVANSNVATVTIVVKPFATNDAYQVPEGLSIDISGLQADPAGILVNDSNQPLTVIAAGRNGVSPLGANPSITFTTLFNGVVTVYASGRFTYVPPANFLGADWFDYQAHDGVSETNIARVLLTVEDVNSVVAVNDGTYTIAYGGSKLENVLLNDFDPEGDPFHITHINGAPVAVGQTVSIPNGTVKLENANGTITITAANGFSGPLSFTYSIVDEPEADEPATATATVFAEVGAQPIVPQDDYYMTQQNTPLHVPTFPWETLLANDPGDPAEVLAFTEKGGGEVWLNGSPATGLTPYEGTLTVYPDGSFDYTPKTGFVGIDSFRYIVPDGLGGTVWANGIITVTPTSSTVTVTTPDPSVYGTSATVSATVTCGAATAPSVGYVTFRLGANVLAAYVPVVNGVATATLPATLPVGSYVIMAEYTGSSQQPTVCPGSFDADGHNVSPKPARVIADNQTKVYGSVFSFNGTEFTTDGFLFEDVVTGAVLASPTGAPATATVTGGPYAVTVNTAVGVGLENYSITYEPGVLTVTPAPLQVQAHDKTRAVGEPNPVLDGVWTGFRNGDVVSAVYTTVAGPTSPAGDYPIVPQPVPNAALDNYTLEIINGTLSIVAKVPSVTTVTGGTFVFDGQPKAQTCTVTGQNGVSLTGYTVSYTPGPGAPVNVGTYTVSCEFPGDTLHEGSSGTNTVVITPKAATVTAGSGSKVYGTVDPALTAPTTAGFVGGDAATLTYAQQRVAGNTVGTYATSVQATGAVLSNYTVSYLGNTFTITKAPLTITANNKTKLQGAANPVLDGTIAGVVNGDVITAAYATTATTTSPVGQYPITPAAVDPNGRLGNYTLTLVPGTLTITSAACDVNGYTTYSQGGWGSKPNGNNPGALLAANFSDVYPNGVSIGGQKTLKFTSAYAIERYLPAGGSPSVLTSSYVNPTSSKGGTLSAQLLAVQLAVDFSDAGVLKAGLGDLVFVSGPMAGQTLRSVLAMANRVFGGETSALPSGMSLSGLAGLLESVVNNFHEGTTNQGLLGCGDGSRPCAPAEFVFNQSSSGSGAAGNIRQFSNNNVPVKVSAFSRDRSSGSWAPAFLGAFGAYGMGVTDSSESGSGDTHTIDNSGRDNYMVFVFDQPVVATKAYLGYVSGDSDAQVWIGTVNGAFNSGVTLSDAVLSGFGSPESSNGGSSARWMTFNGSAKAGNVIVIAASTSSSNDKFKIAKLETSCATPPPPPCVPPVAGNDSRSAVSGAPLMMQVLSNDTDPNGEDLTIVPGGFTQPANGSVTLSGNTFTFTSNSGFTGTTSFTYRVRNESGCEDTATVTITVTAPEPVCQVSTLTFSQSSSSNGSAGNIRTFSANGVSVKVSAFSRDKNKNKWSTAYLGAFGSYGMGVTDSSESGNGATHTVDNNGRNNYMVFAFDEPVIVTKAFLGYVYGD